MGGRVIVLESFIEWDLYQVLGLNVFQISATYRGMVDVVIVGGFRTHPAATFLKGHIVPPSGCLAP
jgi:hypothetical protein